jgi:transposase
MNKITNQLKKLESNFDDSSLVLCYEASYIGFCLQRDLVAAGYRCDVIAPGSIPRKGGSKSDKTDRIDALDLAQFHANDLLTVVEPPDAVMETDRDLIRSRQHTMQQQGDVRRHLQSLLRRNGLHYRAENKTRTHWTKHHYCWLERTIEECEGSLKINLQLLHTQIKALDDILATYTREI